MTAYPRTDGPLSAVPSLALLSNAMCPAHKGEHVPNKDGSIKLICHLFLHNNFIIIIIINLSGFWTLPSKWEMR